ncbi:hypothetical protein KKA13_01595 [Patescibacteria group bacterium]|nr:hypothetical protein [Patescibacteria group bacterium]MBU1612888.1 hypothetical protein [Patescibacteria group bacterium]
MPYNLSTKDGLKKIRAEQAKRLNFSMKGGEYINLQGLKLANIDGIDIPRLEKFAKIMRGLIFATVEAGQSGHPGGSSSKVEQLLALAFGDVLAFDPVSPKHSGRDRVVWSAGHCTPALYSLLSVTYESLRRVGRQFSEAVVHPVFPEDLIRFRRVDGPQGHAESYMPLVDFSTGPSGHGLSAAGGFAISHRACGLPTKVWAIMGDAESEEGMTYEARNILNTVGADNLIVTLDFNHFGIDGAIEEVVSSPYINHWLGLGWNVIEVDGHDILELIHAYHLAGVGFKNGSPTVVICHTVKGKDYGSKENSADSHGSPAKHDEYVKIMKELGFKIPGKAGESMEDIEVVLEELVEQDAQYVNAAMEKNAERIKTETELVKIMENKLKGRCLIDPLNIKRPAKLPKELVFKSGEKVSTRKAAEAWFKWYMKQTGFFFTGAGDVSRSILTGPAENVYGIINKANPLGRGLRFGIAEQNMAMMSSAMTADILPGGFRPVSAFGTFAVFSSMMSNMVRLSVINNHLNPASKGFFIMIASHDGPETGEDGPTHHGLYWMSYFNALPGIKVYKPLDANETIEMLFHAVELGEPIALSLTRTDVPVLKRAEGMPEAVSANDGAYVFKPFSGKEKKKMVLAISGAYVLQNVLSILPELEKQGADIKIIAVTSPELFEDLRKKNPKKAMEILSDKERKIAVALHNGWSGFLHPFILPEKYEERTIGVETYLKSGQAEELYALAEMDAESIKQKLFKLL